MEEYWIVSPQGSVEIYYLENGKYILEQIYMLQRKSAPSVSRIPAACNAFSAGWTAYPSSSRHFCSLLRNGKRVLTKEILMEQMWEEGAEWVDDHALAVEVNRLRGRLGHACIRTVFYLVLQKQHGQRTLHQAVFFPAMHPAQKRRRLFQKVGRRSRMGV